VVFSEPVTSINGALENYTRIDSRLDLLDLPEKQGGGIEGRYTPVYRSKGEKPAFVQGFSSGLFYNLPLHDAMIFTRMRYDAYRGRLYLNKKKYELQANATVTSGDIVLSKKWGRITGIGALGGIAEPNTAYGNQFRIAERFRDGQFPFGAGLRADFSCLSLGIAGTRNLDFAGLMTLQTQSNGAYRNFAVAVVNNAFHSKIALHLLNGDIDLRYDYAAIHNSELLDAKYPMPTLLDAVTRTFNMDVSVEVGESVDLKLNTRYQNGGGFVSGYSLSTEGMQYFLADSMRLSHYSWSVESTFPFGVEAALLGKGLELTIPYGFLYVSAFSSWSYFTSVDYRYYDTKIDYADIGLELRKTLYLGNHLSLKPVLGGSFFSALERHELKKKKTIVILPFWKDAGEHNHFDITTFMLTVSIESTLQIKQKKISIHALQRIPLLSDNKKSSPNTNSAGSSDSSKGSGTDELKFGGFEIGFSVAF